MAERLRKVAGTFAEVSEGKAASHVLGVLAYLSDPARAKYSQLPGTVVNFLRSSSKRAAGAGSLSTLTPGARLTNPDNPTTRQSSVTAINVVLRPDETMVGHARAVNARLLGAYPQGFALDADHQPHLTVLQQFVGTADLDRVYTAANTVFARVNPAAWQLRAVRHYYLSAPPVGIAGIVVELAEDLFRLQQRLIDAIAPYAMTTGTAAAFASTQQGRDIQEGLIAYVSNFVSDSAGHKFNPHVTTGVGALSYLDAMLAEPFEAFTFSPTGAAIYQLGTFGTARKELTVLPLSR